MSVAQSAHFRRLKKMAIMEAQVAVVEDGSEVIEGDLIVGAAVDIVVVDLIEAAAATKPLNCATASSSNYEEQGPRTPYSCSATLSRPRCTCWNDYVVVS
jgi:regulator of RNase E activity RraA